MGDFELGELDGVLVVEQTKLQRFAVPITKMSVRCIRAWDIHDFGCLVGHRLLHPALLFLLVRARGRCGLSSVVSVCGSAREGLVSAEREQGVEKQSRS